MNTEYYRYMPMFLRYAELQVFRGLLDINGVSVYPDRVYVASTYEVGPVYSFLLPVFTLRMNYPGGLYFEVLGATLRGQHMSFWGKTKKLYSDFRMYWDSVLRE